MIRERSLLFEDGRLAILTEAQGPARLVLVLSNAGFIHRMGPFRLHVALARQLASLGVCTVRVDLPGIGDSLRAASRPQLSLAGELLDRLAQETGCERFIVGGICSAADFGWSLALADPRVAGVLLLDALARRELPAYRLGQFQLHWRRGPRAWLDTLRRRLRPRPAQEAGAGPRAAPPTDAELRDWPAPGSESAQLAKLVERGTELLFVYTGGALTYFSHPRQFHTGYGQATRSPRVRFRFWPDCDHLFYRPEHRERLLGEVSCWIQQRFGETP
ncbi:alpha/beta fold hydrolase [Pseudomarimonas salicorniae]|uniref:Alpha/beta fold hydrolase n=1 Tax=Pseudomarimonas salicorniae TaxID=2933270 RepID=A0ABT0GHI5_9GAMM|nr:alpha/beta fold hydrolase [Lysobacter sp. CAU 1642]MCK7594001.1 alpha/beta fold hydrolase [Lysobacter sp. CAU 1642]